MIDWETWNECVVDDCSESCREEIFRDVALRVFDDVVVGCGSVCL